MQDILDHNSENAPKSSIYSKLAFGFSIASILPVLAVIVFLYNQSIITLFTTLFLILQEGILTILTVFSVFFSIKSINNKEKTKAYRPITIVLNIVFSIFIVFGFFVLSKWL